MCSSDLEAAREAGAAFWPTSEAMRAEGGMGRFVQRGWAGKDYTHINYAGGRRVAWALVDALNERLREADARIVRVRREQQIVDSLRRSLLDRRLFSPIEAGLLGRSVVGRVGRVVGRVVGCRVGPSGRRLGRCLCLCFGGRGFGLCFRSEEHTS